MLYVKHVTKKGKEKFYPIRDNNVYVFCERCEKMVYISEPHGYIYELGACSDSIENDHLCDECFEWMCRIEDEYLKAKNGKFMEENSVEAISVGSGDPGFTVV